MARLRNVVRVMGPICHTTLAQRTADTDCPPAAEGVGDRVGLREMVGVELLVGEEHAAPYSVWQPSRQYSGVDPHQPFLQHDSDTAKCEEDGGVIQALKHVGSDMGHTHFRYGRC